MLLLLLIIYILIYFFRYLLFIYVFIYWWLFLHVSALTVTHYIKRFVLAAPREFKLKSKTVFGQFRVSQKFQKQVNIKINSRTGFERSLDLKPKSK